MSWYEDMLERAKTFVQRGEEVHPILFLKKGSKIGILPLGQFAHDKEVVASLLHMVVQIEDPDEYLFVTEAFVKMIDTKDESENAVGKLLVSGTLQVSQIPSSKESIVVLYGDRKGEKLGTIVFERKGKEVAFETIKWLEGDEMKGRFTGLRKPGFIADHQSGN